MGRLLVAVVFVVLAIWLLRRALRSGEPDKPRDAAQPPASTQGELVSCAQCGVLLPRAEARTSAARLYCSDEHARLGPASGPGAR